MKEYFIADPLMPAFRQLLCDEDRRGFVRRLVGEDEPHTLGDLARIGSLRIQVDVPHVRRLDEVGVDAL